MISTSTTGWDGNTLCHNLMYFSYIFISILNAVAVESNIRWNVRYIPSIDNDVHCKSPTCPANSKQNAYRR